VKSNAARVTSSSVALISEGLLRETMEAMYQNSHNALPIFSLTSIAENGNTLQVTGKYVCHLILRIYLMMPTQSIYEFHLVLKITSKHFLKKSPN
jgi:hypothetical protein